MERFIIANGGEVAKSVTNKCTHLISAETGTKKCADAEKKGVIVVDEAWVREQCGEDTEAMDEDDDEDDEDEEEEDDDDDDDEEEEEEDIPPPTAKKATKAKKVSTTKKTVSAPSGDDDGALAGLTICMTGTLR